MQRRSSTTCLRCCDEDQAAPAFIARPAAHPDAVLVSQALGAGTNVVPNRVTDTVEVPHPYLALGNGAGEFRYGGVSSVQEYSVSN